MTASHIFLDKYQWLVFIQHLFINKLHTQELGFPLCSNGMVTFFSDCSLKPYQGINILVLTRLVSGKCKHLTGTEGVKNTLVCLAPIIEVK